MMMGRVETAPQEMGFLQLCMKNTASRSCGLFLRLTAEA